MGDLLPNPTSEWECFALGTSDVQLTTPASCRRRRTVQCPWCKSDLESIRAALCPDCNNRVIKFERGGALRNVAGSMLPFVLRTFGVDPASASAPFVAKLVDVSGLVIYFTVASIVLNGTLL